MAKDAEQAYLYFSAAVAQIDDVWCLAETDLERAVKLKIEAYKEQQSMIRFKRRKVPPYNPNTANENEIKVPRLTVVDDLEGLILKQKEKVAALFTTLESTCHTHKKIVEVSAHYDMFYVCFFYFICYFFCVCMLKTKKKKKKKKKNCGT